MPRRPTLALVAPLLVALFTAPAGADTVADVQARGALRCGVGGDVRGLSWRDAQGQWTGLEVDFCRAVAAAVLGRDGKVEFVPLGVDERLAALRDGRVDLLLRNTSWTSGRDLTAGVTFTTPLFLDGQGFMVPRSTAILSVNQLDGAKVCVTAGTSTAVNAPDWFARNGLGIKLQPHADFETAAKAYLAGKCGALTADKSQLHSLRAGLPEPAAQRVLPELISKQLLTPAVKKGDARWFDLVRWTLFTLLQAEELGIDSQGVAIRKTRDDSLRLRALLDLDGTTGRALGAAPEWGYQVLLTVGNYGEMFARNLGPESGLDVARGHNALWRDGGLLYAPPME